MNDAALRDFDALCDERFDGWVEELRDFCSIPSETDQFAELDRGAAWVEQRLSSAGAEVTVLREEGVPPLVVGEMGSGPRTLIGVQHYDVQPAAPIDLWETPPFDPVVRDGRLYARGACDNKGELLHRIQAGEALRDAIGELPCRIRFIVEGEEESDSAHLAPLLERRPEFFEGHGALIEGGGVDEKGRPLLVCGVRGMVYAELSVRTLAFDAHPYWTPIDAPIVDAASRAHEGIFSEEPQRWFSAGGTAPMHQVCAPRRLPMVTLGAGDAENRNHAPNESYSLDLMRRAAKVTGRFLREFAAIEA